MGSRMRADEQGMTEEVHDALTGHANGSVGRSYGHGMPVAVLAEAMAKVRYGPLA